MAALNEILDKQAIADIVKLLAANIDKDYACEKVDEVIAIGVLKGAFVFLADLMRELKTKVKVDFIQVSSYGAGTASSGKIVMVKPPSYSLADKHVLIVEDILDTGLTLEFLADYFKEAKPKSLKTCVFVDKKCCRINNFDANYVGYVAEDRFLVGYGLDYNGDYRYLPTLCELFLD